MTIRARLEGGRGRGRAGGVAAELDVGLRGLDVVDHGAELVDEAHQSHVHALADGLARHGEVAVERVVMAAVEIVEGEGRGCRGARRSAGGVLHDDGVQAERLDEQGGLELQRREVDHAFSAETT